MGASAKIGSAYATAFGTLMSLVKQAGELGQCFFEGRGSDFGVLRAQGLDVFDATCEHTSAINRCAHGLVVDPGAGIAFELSRYLRGRTFLSWV